MFSAWQVTLLAFILLNEGWLSLPLWCFPLRGPYMVVQKVCKAVTYLNCVSLYQCMHKNSHSQGNIYVSHQCAVAPYTVTPCILQFSLSEQMRKAAATLNTLYCSWLTSLKGLIQTHKDYSFVFLSHIACAITVLMFCICACILLCYTYLS